ncbi:MAG TPA: DUF4347 domain-containing protein, partial [Burkholderiales bacterium]|nr:DUF4347 domain-containing protein [Burkholderiales bacterium]
MSAQSDGRNLEVVLIDWKSDGIARITDTLARYSNLDAVHVISHARDGDVQLGSVGLDFQTLVKRAGEIKKWGDALAAGGDILFYGCDLAESADGKALVDAIARLTGADVAASENLTGSAAQGGDWTLEFKTGAIEAHALAGASDWDHTLLTVTVSNNADSVNGNTSSISALIGSPGGDGISLREAILAANNTPGADTIQFAIGSGAVKINVNSTLTITDSVVIDGRTQGGAGYTGPPLIELNGSGTGANVDGLVFTAGSSELHGLIINRFGLGGGSGNGGTGIVVNANARIVAQGNYIGTDASGSAAAGNGDWGIWLKSSNNTIGGTTAADGNVIAANGIDGINVDGSLTTLTGNVIQGNYIGTNAAGTAALGNGETGIWLNRGNNNTIGGAAAGAGNVISGNGFSGGWQGVLVQNSDGNLIQGNLVGTNAAGTAAMPNGWAGIELNTGSDNNSVIGNLVSGNTKDGIVIWQSTGNIVQGNTIGTNLAGTGGNGQSGVWITDASNNTIGGTSVGQGNLISGNVRAGVEVDGTSSTASGNVMLGNSIYNNGGLGIDLNPNPTSFPFGDGVTANDPGDTDAGPNGLQNYPVLALAITNGSQIQISGTLNSTANTAFRIEFFASSTSDSSGNGEGQRYLGAVTVTTDSSGNAVFSKIVLPAAVLAGEYITATATGGSGTSEFAQNIQATPAHEIRGTVFDDVDGDANIAEAGTGAFTGAMVKLYLDDGDGVIDAGDLLQSIATTNASGQYSFGGLLDGTYYVVVDSKTLSPNTAVWADQTYGSAGSALGAGFASVGGALYGGRNPAISDDASSLLTAEHVTKVTVANASVASVDSGFSMSAIVSNRGDAGDDDPANPRMQQGTLRQFILNSNALALTQSAYFAIGAVGSQQTIAVTGAALPMITDAVVLDARTQGGAGYAGPPLIELSGASAGANVDGLTLGAAASTVRGFVIDRFSRDGIAIAAGSGSTVAGNWIGTSASGALDAGNGRYGIQVASAGNTIGGLTTADRNVVSGNDSDGIMLGAGGNTVMGNYVGTDATGTFAIANSEDGIWVNAASGNTIGGSSAGARNVISGNAWSGIDLSGGGSNNVIRGNYIGPNAAGAGAIGNVSQGVYIHDGTGTQVGGTNAGDGNVISGNGGRGVEVDSGNGDSILGNSIFANGGLGIDLSLVPGGDGVTADDPPAALDGDTGPDNLQNFPVLTSVTTSSVTGTLNSSASATFRIELFASAAPDPSGNGEGQVYLGSVSVTTNAAGTASFTTPVALALGQWVTATATNSATGDSSEFSAAVPVNSAPVNGVPVPQTVNEDTPLTLSTISVSDAQNNLNSVALAVVNGKLAAIAAGGAAVSGGGTASVTITGSQAAINATLASLVYQGNLNFNGTDTLTMTSTDAGGLQDVDTVVITVNPVNDPPVANNDAAAVQEDVTLNASGNVLANDTDVDAGDTKTVTLVNG